MDNLDLPDLADCFDPSLVCEPMEPIEMAPEDEALIAALVEQAEAITAAKTQLRASRQKREDPNSSPSQKISIRLPKPLLGLLRQHAALLGIPYQTFIKLMLHDIALSRVAAIS